MAYTREQLIQMGAVPTSQYRAAAVPNGKSLTREQLLQMGAVPTSRVATAQVQPQASVPTPQPAKPGFFSRVGEITKDFNPENPLASVGQLGQAVVQSGAGKLFTGNTQKFADTLGTVAAHFTGDLERINESARAEAEADRVKADLLNGRNAAHPSYNSPVSPEQQQRIKNQLAGGQQTVTAERAVPSLMKGITEGMTESEQNWATGKRIFGEGLGTALEATAGGRLQMAPGGLSGGVGGVINRNLAGSFQMANKAALPLASKAVAYASPVKKVGQAFIRGAKGSAAYGGAAGLSSALQDPKKNIGQIAQSTAAAAVTSGIIGGSLAASGQVLSMMKNALRPSKEAVVTSAIKPRSSNEGFDDDLKKTLEVTGKDAERIVKAENPLREFHEVIKENKKSIWNGIEQKVNAGGKQGLFVDGTGIADDIERTMYMNTKIARENPQALETLSELADTYRGSQIPVMEAEDILEQTNGLLDALASKDHLTRAQLLRTNPNLAAQDAIAGGLRKQLDYLVDIGGAKAEYGALRNVQEELMRRIPVAERANLYSLSQSVSAARTAGNVLSSTMRGDFLGAIGSIADVATASALKEADKSGEKIRQAFQVILKSQQAQGTMSKIGEVVAGGSREALPLIQKTLLRKGGEFIGK